MSDERELYIGIMTGTSLDGVDCVVTAFADKPKELVFHNKPIPTEIRNELLSLAGGHKVDIERLARMHFVLAQLYADAVKGCLLKAELEPSGIRAIGLHGQTIRHLPKKILFHTDFAPVGATFQLGSGSALAALVGIDVVHDFRSGDIALGGEGAPLMPMFDARFLQSNENDRVVLNIGGIANITCLPKKGEGIVAFDTGPGNMLMDAIAERFFNVSYDEGGALASQGSVNEPLIARLLEHHYFSAPPPKSTGRELFGDEFFGQFVEEVESGKLSPDDSLCTATELTARTITDAIRSLHIDLHTLEVIVSGGGVRNYFLMDRLSALISPATVRDSDAYGISSRSKEALAFAYFAKAFLDDDHIHLPETTGATRKILLGSLSKGT